jgi:hypothetical protein
MPYINRNENNKITAIFANKQYENQEFLADDSEEIVEFLKPSANIEILAQIAQLESSQLRSLREMIITPNDFAKNKLMEIDIQIKELRNLLI